MKKFGDNRSNHYHTSREFSSLISSSSESQSNKKSETLQNFSDSYIKELSKKIKNKSIHSARDQSIVIESNFRDMFLSSPFKKNQSEPFFPKIQDLSKEGINEKDEVNPLINEFFEGSKEMTNKDYNQIDQLDVKNDEVKLFLFNNAYIYFYYFKVKKTIKKNNIELFENDKTCFGSHQ